MRTQIAIALSISLIGAILAVSGTLASLTALSMAGACLFSAGLSWAISQRLAQKTEDKKSQEIRSIEGKFNSLFRGSLDVILVIETASGKILTANPAVKNILGYEPGDLTTQHFSTLFPSEDDTAEPTGLEYLFGESVGPQDFLKNDGTVCPMELVVSMVQWEEQNAILAMLRDVTDRKKAEDLLLESEGRLKVTMESIQEGIVALDSEFRPYLYNTSAKNYLELLSNGFTSTEPIERIGNYSMQTLVGSYPSGHTFHEIEIQYPEYRIFETTSHALENGQIRGGWVLTMKEVTMQRAMRQKSEAQGKLAALGQLTAGIAHDFRNALAIIIGAAQVRLEDSDLDDKPRKTLQEILDQSNRAGRLIRQMLDFGRKTSSQKSLLDLKQEMEKLLNLLQSALPGHIHVSWNVSSQEGFEFMGNADQIHQIVTNLAINAMDAMADGGELQFRLSRKTFGATDTLPFNEMAPGEWITLETIDNGSGIPPKSLKRIFEPFYTTKEVGKGTGLGLSQVYGLIRDHNGFVDVQSQVGKGSVFTVYFPVAQVDKIPKSDSSEVLNTKNTPQQPDGALKLQAPKKCRILLVEDEEHILNLMKMYVSKMGHEVITAKDGREALELLDGAVDPTANALGQDRAENKINLIITDATMPEMTGIDLASVLLEEKCPINIMVTSGEADEHWLPNIVGWLAKPVNPKELESLVDYALTHSWQDLVKNKS